MQLTNKVGASNVAKAATTSSVARVAVPVVARQVRRASVVVKAAAAATAPVIADNATVDKCVNAVRFLAIGACVFLLQQQWKKKKGASFARPPLDAQPLPMTLRAPAPDGPRPRPWRAASGSARGAREESGEPEGRARGGHWERLYASSALSLAPFPPFSPLHDPTLALRSPRPRRSAAGKGSIARARAPIGGGKKRRS